MELLMKRFERQEKQITASGKADSLTNQIIKQNKELTRKRLDYDRTSSKTE